MSIDPPQDEPARPDPGGPTALGMVVTAMTSLLETSLSRSDPAADIAAADELGARLLSALDAGPNWDASIHWVGQTLAKAFIGRPADCGRAAEKLEMHFHAVFAADHPRANRSTQQRTPDGRTLSPVRLDVARAFVREVMPAYSKEQRSQFYAAISRHELWEAIAVALAETEASADEIQQLVSALSGHAELGLPGGVSAGLTEWARRQPDRAIGLVDELVAADLTDAAVAALQVLVESLSQDPTREAWRDETLERLFATRNRRAWNLVVLLECAAAPTDSPVEPRHARMLDRVLRAPGVLLPPAIFALRRDAPTHPAASLRTLERLLEFADLASRTAPNSVDVLTAAADVASSVVNGLRKRGLDPSPVVAFLPALLPLGPDRQRHGLDYVLESLLEDRSEQVSKYFGDWLGAHAQALVAGHSTLDELFPVLAHKLGPEGTSRWLCDVLVAGEAPARAAAANLLGSRKGEVPAGAFRDVSEPDAAILMHEMVGCGRIGVPLIAALVALARRWPSLIAEVGQMIADDIAPNYPEQCKGLLPSLATDTEGSTPDVASAWSAAAGRIKDVLDTLMEAHRVRLSIPEIVRTAPAAGAWRLAQQREMDKAYRAAQGRSVFASLVSVVPIGRGAKSLMAGFPDAAPTGFQDHSFTMVLPAGEIIDPIGERFRRFSHLTRAEELRRKRTGAP